MANLTTKAAKQCFSRYIKRENKVSENLNPYLMKTSGSNADGAPLQKDNSLTSFHEGLAREALRELSPEEVRNPEIEDEKRLLNSERRPRKNLFSLKIDFLSRVASPKKSPQAAQSEALEDAKFFTQIQSEKDRRTIKIRLAQMTKQYDKTAIKVSTERKTNRSSADVILNKVLGKKFDLVSHQAATGEPTTPTNAGLDSHRYVLPVDGSQLPTRRSSQKTISTQEFNSLYNQKLLKGRASTRNLSPANMAFLENNSKPQSLNELSTREYTSAPRSDFAHSRKLSSTEAWSLNDLKVFPETEKAGSIKIYEGLSHSRNNLLNAEIEKELMMLPIIPDKENRVISNEKPGTTANLLKRKNSSRVMNLPLGKGNNTGEGLKENSMYAQLNETKEWRLRIFKKPQRRSGLLSSRGFGENQDVTKEKMRLEG